MSASLVHQSLKSLPMVASASRGRVSRAPMQVRAMSSNTSFHHGITHISYEGNSFGIKFNNTGVRVLVDPWLVGDLVFADQEWLYRGKKRVVKVDLPQLAAETDVIVLSQYLDDHTHMPTLEAMPKTIPVVANPEAAERIAPLGFKSVTTVDHGQTVEVAEGKLRITGTPGALVGPPWSKRQNGLLFRENAEKTPDGNSASLYYEPHCDFIPGSLSGLGKVDVVITPVKTTLMGVGPVAYPLVMGDMNLTDLLKELSPRVLVPLLNAEIDQEGPLSALVIERGSSQFEMVKQSLRGAGFGELRLEFPAPPGEAMAIAL